MLVVVTVLISVCGFRVMSLPDKFLSATVTPDLPGLNSEVFPRMNTLVHLVKVPQAHEHTSGAL